MFTSELGHVLAMTQWNTFKICVYKQREVKKLNSSTKRMYAY